MKRELFSSGHYFRKSVTLELLINSISVKVKSIPRVNI